MYPDKHAIISAARSEAARMQSSVAGAESGARVTMEARQFATLASLVESLCEIAQGTVSGSMGDPQYWVPLEEYAKLKREKQKLAAHCASFDLQLTGWDPALPGRRDDIGLRGPDALAA